MNVCGGWGEGSLAGENQGINGSGTPPFLRKTYDMVDDPSTDSIVSWSLSGSTFVVWNPPVFSRELLSKYFKHNNFSSFVRQLNTYGSCMVLKHKNSRSLVACHVAVDFGVCLFYVYGFRKIDPDRWEFSNEGFLRGQKHLLSNINRRKSSQAHTLQQVQPQNSPVNLCIEVGKFGLDEEIERLKRDKNVLMQELVRLRQQHQATGTHLQALSQSLHRMEGRQQKMVSFLAQAMHSPDILVQLMQQNNVDNHIPLCNKKRKFPNRGELDGESTPSAGQIIMHQSVKKPESFARLEKFNSPTDSLYIKTIPSTWSSEVSSQGGPLSSRIPHVQSTPITMGAGKDIPPVGIGFQDSAPANSVMTNESITEFLSPCYPATEVEVPLFSPLGEIEGMIPVELEKFSAEGGFDIHGSGGEMKLLGLDSFWEQFFSVGVGKVDSSIAEANGIPEVQLKASNRTENMENLTKQIGLLIPST